MTSSVSSSSSTSAGGSFSTPLVEAVIEGAEGLPLAFFLLFRFFFAAACQPRQLERSVAVW